MPLHKLPLIMTFAFKKMPFLYTKLMLKNVPTVGGGIPLRSLK